MTTLTASSEKVARSWLMEKLLGPEKTEKPKPDRPRPLRLQDREAALEDAYKFLKNSLIHSIKSEFSALDSAENRIAKQHGIDPLFLNWYVVNTLHWPSMPTRLKEGLKTMQSARLWFGEVPNSWSRMRVPSMEDAQTRDAALKELGEWFLKNFVTKVERKFANAIWTKSRELLDLFKGGKGSKSQASILLLRDFKNRLGEDRFQLKPAVRRLVELFD